MMTKQGLGPAPMIASGCIACLPQRPYEFGFEFDPGLPAAARDALAQSTTAGERIMPLE